jgi:hypothetical protein
VEAATRGGGVSNEKPDEMQLRRARLIVSGVDLFKVLTMTDDEVNEAFDRLDDSSGDG